MQNTKYENVVIATIQNLAALVSNAAHDSIEKKMTTALRIMCKLCALYTQTTHSIRLLQV